jgi:hypothetical protein
LGKNCRFPAKTSAKNSSGSQHSKFFRNGDEFCVNERQGQNYSKTVGFTYDGNNIAGLLKKDFFSTNWGSKSALAQFFVIMMYSVSIRDEFKDFRKPIQSSRFYQKKDCFQ